jgi:hypothetical protein
MVATGHEPEPGLVLVSTSPALSTATHRDADGQETPVRALPASIGVGADQVGEPDLKPTEA